MMYIINCRLRNGFDIYHKELVKEIYKKFGLVITKEENLPTHFTLKYWFETDKISEIETLFERFAKTHKKAQVRVGGVGSFPPKVVFLNCVLSPAAKKTFSELIAELKKVSWLPWDKYDGKGMHFHSTIAEECNEKFSEVLNFAQSKEPKYFDCWFDNITILKKVGGTRCFGKWEIHKVFELAK